VRSVANCAADLFNRVSVAVEDRIPLWGVDYKVWDGSSACFDELPVPIGIVSRKVDLDWDDICRIQQFNNSWIIQDRLLQGMTVQTPGGGELKDHNLGLALCSGKPFGSKINPMDRAAPGETHCNKN
jgi:hypothetical protein